MHRFQLRLNSSAVPLLLSGRAVLRLLLTVLLLAELSACSQSGQSTASRRMRLAVGEIKEVTLPARSGSPLVGTSENQEVVDVSQQPFNAADSSALKQGQPVSAVFLIKGVTIGTVRVIFAEKTAGEDGSGRVRQTYAVQVISK